MAIYSQSMINSDPDWVHDRYTIMKTEESCYIRIFKFTLKKF